MYMYRLGYPTCSWCFKALDSLKYEVFICTYCASKRHSDGRSFLETAILFDEEDYQFYLDEISSEDGDEDLDWAEDDDGGDDDGMPEEEEEREMVWDGVTEQWTATVDIV